MINVTLKQLRYVGSLAQHRHFGRAAAACAVSQPALSVQIKHLEDELGTPLFERGARQVKLTGFGEEFARRAGAILRAVDELGDLARASQTHPMGSLRLGVIPTIAPYLLPRVIRKLSETHEGMDIQVRETQTPRLVRELLEGRIDTAIVALPIGEPSLSEVAIFKEHFVLVRPLKNAKDPVPDCNALQEMRLLLLEEGHCFRDQALSFCNIDSSLPRDGLDGSSLSTLVQMVGAGIGITLIPEMAIAVEADHAAVSLARFANPQPSRTVGMIWRKSSPLTAQLEQIAEIVRHAAEPAVPDGRLAN